jgi:hypothetical protein
MSGDYAPHARAVALFEALVERPVQELCQRPADLVRALGRAPATGYRAVAEAEASGLLQRDAQEHYRRGDLSCSIGLSALGFGDLAHFAEPILVDLRESVRLTSVLAVAKGTEVRIGPYSLGRGAGYLRPVPVCSVLVQHVFDGRPQVDLQLSMPTVGQVWMNAVVLGRQGDAQCLIGVLTRQQLIDGEASVDQKLRHVTERLVWKGDGP